MERRQSTDNPVRSQLIAAVAALLLLVAAPPAFGQVLWSVTSADERVNWVLGTVHSEDPRLLDFPPELLEVLAAAERMALELVPDSSMLETLNQAMHFREPRLRELLPAELYTQVVKLIDEHYGVGEPALARMRPWAVAMTLSLPPPETGLFMDLALSFRFAGQGRPVMALETLEEQLAFLQGLEEDAQIQLIEQAVAEHAAMPAVFDRLIRTYLSGDLEALEQLSAEQLSVLDPAIIEHFHQVGLVERNQVMLERAMPYLEAGGLLIAVGALHLPGEHGLLRLLEDAGFTIEGIPYSARD